MGLPSLGRAMQGHPPLSLTPGVTLSPRCDIWAARARRRLGWDETAAGLRSSTPPACPWAVL